MRISLCMFCHSACSLLWPLCALCLCLAAGGPARLLTCISELFTFPLGTHRQILQHANTSTANCSSLFSTLHVCMCSLKKVKPLNLVRNSRLPRKLYKYCWYEGKITRQQLTKNCDSATSMNHKNCASFSVVLHFVSIAVLYCRSPSLSSSHSPGCSRLRRQLCTPATFAEFAFVSDYLASLGLCFRG